MPAREETTCITWCDSATERRGVNGGKRRGSTTFHMLCRGTTFASGLAGTAIPMHRSCNPITQPLAEGAFALEAVVIHDPFDHTLAS